MQSSCDPAVIRLLDDLAAVRKESFEVVQQVRAEVRAVSSDVGETVRYGGIMFATNTPFCGVFAYAHHVSVEFSQGWLLEDRHGVLEGGGKYRRHIKLFSADDIATKYLADYLRQAADRASGAAAS